MVYQIDCIIFNSRFSYIQTFSPASSEASPCMAWHGEFSSEYTTIIYYMFQRSGHVYVHHTLTQDMNQMLYTDETSDSFSAAADTVSI